MKGLPQDHPSKRASPPGWGPWDKGPVPPEGGGHAVAWCKRSRKIETWHQLQAPSAGSPAPADSP